MYESLQCSAVTADDVRYETSLAAKFRDELGFLPRLAVERYAEWGGVHRVLENGDPAGFVVCRFTPTSDPTASTILQAAIAMDAQRRHAGLYLIDQMARRAKAAGRLMLQCWCADDLEANAFWLAAGFTHVRQREGGKSRKRVLTLYRRPLSPFADLTAETLGRPRLPGGLYAPTPAALPAACQMELPFADSRPLPQRLRTR
jgi:ribosomal protein S18 acetylase RimI-like enzyme